MRKIAWLSVICVSMLLTACGSNTSKSQGDAPNESYIAGTEQQDSSEMTEKHIRTEIASEEERENLNNTETEEQAMNMICRTLLLDDESTRRHWFQGYYEETDGSDRGASVCRGIRRVTEEIRGGF